MPALRLRAEPLSTDLRGGGILADVWLACLLASAIGLAGLAACVRAGEWRRHWVLGVALALAPWLTLAAAPGPGSAPSPPSVREPGITVGSGACRACHPAEHASWRSSFHRTMTQRAAGEAILAPEGDAVLEVPGGRARISHRRGELHVEVPDPEVLARGPARGAAPTVQRRVVLTTGSHHYQAYWFEGSRPGELRAAPFVWHREAERYLPRHDVFLQPPDAPDALVRWNSNCLACHATFAEPRHDDDRDAFDTRVVELGVACEACHGPGGAHVDHYGDPLARVFRPEVAEHIVDPRALDKARSSMICGQCHSYALPRDEDEWWTHGYARTFSAGQDLAESRLLLTRAAFDGGAHRSIRAAGESLFWEDGTIRVGGRELNGLVESACFSRGQGERQLGCVDCHELHGDEADPAWKNDQLAPEARTNAICASCHAGLDDRAHTQHAGPIACASCHMPRVSYALFRAQVSHRVDVPQVGPFDGRPPACNLCHLDRTLAWTARELATRWGRGDPDEPNLPDYPSEEPLAYGIDRALRGDAATRVVLADHLLAPEAIATVGDHFQVPVLATLLDDPYSAVRFVAARALVEHGDLSPGEYDFLAPSSARRAIAERLLARFEAASHPDRLDAPELLLPKGALDRARLAAWLARRDDRTIVLAE
jgi:hypothetical protein